uniref:DUF834 domain-containing protein n=1 Tax=Oryza brachyantha TaxID=4533 RepID=J3MFU6_ORYBR
MAPPEHNHLVEGRERLTGGDAVKGVVGADGVEVHAGEVDGAAADGGEDEAEEGAPIAALRSFSI